MARYSSILDTIGNTPIVRLSKLAPPGVNVFVKLESFNPMSSVKDRMARAVIERAEASGELRPGMTVIEATSGNTGIGLAMVCAQKGYPLVVTMAENFSVERRKLLRFLGAKVVLTPASEKGTGMLNKAIELSERHGYYLCRQFENEANADAHTATTAQEILRDFAGDRLDYWVSTFGTGGTIKGVSRALKAARPDVRIVAAEPDNAQLLGSGIPQPLDETGKPRGSHPRFRPHVVQGTSPDFVAKLTRDALAAGSIDRIVPVAGDDALKMARELASREGILVGISSGAALAAALTIARESPPGTNIVCMLPDTGERYQSTVLFENVGEHMNPEELALSNSTPGYRFEIAAAAPPPSKPAAVEPLDADAVRFVDETIATKPVVMFALEWCEFCWAVRKFFAALGVPYESVDLDSVAYQRGDRGAKIRAVLAERTGEVTIPQIYIHGERVGGCNALFEAYANGMAQRLLEAAGVARALPKLDPTAFLPKWQQPRHVANGDRR
jgi:cysteine synthase A